LACARNWQPLACDDTFPALQAEELEEAAERARERAADQGLSAEDAEARLASAWASLSAEQQALRDAQAEAAEASADALQRGASAARLRAEVAHLEVHGCPSGTPTTTCLLMASGTSLLHRALVGCCAHDGSQRIHKL